MLVLRPLTVLADAVRRALRIAALVLGRIGAGRRRRAAGDRALAALAERFPDAPEHWLRFIAERAPALASAGDMGALRIPDVAEAAAPEPRRLPSPVGPRAVPDRAPVDPMAPAASSLGRTPAPGQRPRAPLLRLEPTRHNQVEAPPIRPKARDLVRVLDPSGHRPRPAIGTKRPEPAPSPSVAAEPALPPPTAHAIEAGGARERTALPWPEQSRPFGGLRRLARRIVGSVRAVTTVPQRSRPGQSGRNADPQGERRGPTHLFVVADERSGCDLDIASADHPGRRQAGPTPPRQVSDRSGDRGLALVSAAPSEQGTTDGVIAWPPFDRRAGEPEGWTALVPTGRRPEHPVEPTRSRRVEAVDPSRPDRPARPGWPALPWTEPARIGDAPVDPPRLDRLRQEQEVGLWSA